MSLVSQHIVGSESFFSKTSGIGGKLRKKSEDFRVDEVVSIPGRSHWIWMQNSPNGKHQILKIRMKYHFLFFIFYSLHFINIHTNITNKSFST